MRICQHSFIKLYWGAVYRIYYTAVASVNIASRGYNVSGNRNKLLYWYIPGKQWNYYPYKAKVKVAAANKMLQRASRIMWPTISMIHVAHQSINRSCNPSIMWLINHHAVNHSCGQSKAWCGQLINRGQSILFSIKRPPDGCEYSHVPVIYGSRNMYRTVVLTFNSLHGYVLLVLAFLHHAIVGMNEVAVTSYLALNSNIKTSTRCSVSHPIVRRCSTTL